MRFVLLAGLLASCATVQQFRPREGQEVAAHIIWVETYGRRERPPLVRWVEGDALDCTDPNSGRPGFYTPGLGCREGRTLSPLGVACAWRGDERSFAETTMAHEYMHALQLLDGIVDPHHKRPEWQEGGVVDQANLNLIKAGR